MVRHHRRLRCWLVVFGGSLACWVASAADPLPQQVEHPFRNLAAWLRQASPDMRSADPKTISRGITVLSNSQSYVKSFDGMAYELKGKIKEGGSTADIKALQERAELYESASSAKKARKLVKLLIEVEKGLNSAEVAEIASQPNPAKAARYMKDAGLRFLPRPPPVMVAQPSPSSEDTGGDSSSTFVAGAGKDGVNSTPRENKASEGGPTSRSRGEKKPSPSSLSAKAGSKMKARAVGETTGTTKRRRDSSINGGRRGNSSSSRSSSSSSSSKKKRKTKKRAGGGGGGKEGGEGTAGKPLEAFVVTAAGCEVRCLLMLDEKGGGGEEKGRLVVAVGDSLTGEALLESLIEEPAVVQLASHGLMREVAYVNRVAFQSACDILELAGPFIKAAVEPGGAFEGYPVHCAGHSFGGAVAACLAGVLDGAIDVEASNGDEGTGGNSRRGPAAEGKQRRAGKGGGTSRDRWSDDSEEYGDGTDSSGDGGSDAIRAAGAAPYVGVCRDRVTCVTLGCPPCLSQNLRMPFVTSFVLGDDMVPRTTHESLRRLKRRLLQVMPKGKGLLSQGVAFSTSLFTDVAGVAMQGVRQATTLGEDDARLSVPGRVWFAKPRRLKNGATLSRVMQGNLKEDMLWQLHDIMLTKSMLSHHQLDKYIKILDRV